MDPQPVSASSWNEFWGAWELFRDPMLCALIAGGVLGFLGVYVVLRRMVFVSAAVTQSAGLGVALAFYAQIHLGVTVDPTVGAVGVALLATMLLMMEPSRLRLTRESLLGLAYAFTGGAAILVGDRIAVEGSYPSRETLAALAGVVVKKLAMAPAASSGCCGPDASGKSKPGCC